VAPQVIDTSWLQIALKPARRQGLRPFRRKINAAAALSSDFAGLRRLTQHLTGFRLARAMHRAASRKLRESGSRKGRRRFQKPAWGNDTTALDVSETRMWWQHVVSAHFGDQTL